MLQTVGMEALDVGKVRHEVQSEKPGRAQGVYQFGI